MRRRGERWRVGALASAGQATKGGTVTPVVPDVALTRTLGAWTSSEGGCKFAVLMQEPDVHRGFTVCLVLATSHQAAAQDSLVDSGPTRDSTPFRHGQWATQFGAGSSLVSLGALAFTTSHRAWLIDIRINGGHSHSEYTIPGDSLVAEEFTSDFSIGPRLGLRFYHVRKREIAGFESVGVSGGYVHSCRRSTFLAYSACSNGWSAGVFGELGGAYLLTPHLSIGATASLAFTYQRTSGMDSRSGRSTFWSYSGGLQGLSLLTTLYF